MTDLRRLIDSSSQIWPVGRSLVARLRWQFVLLGVLPVIAVFAATWLVLVPALVGQADVRNREVALVVRDQLGLQFELRLNAAKTLAQSLRGRNPSEVQRSLELARSTDAFLQGVFAIDASGRVFAAALAPNASRDRDDTLGLNISSLPHVAQARARGEPVWSDAFLSALTGGLTAALAVPSGDGLLVLELSVAALSRSVRELARDGGTQVAIVDRVGRVIAHPEDHMARQQESLQTLAPVREALAGREGAGRIEDSDGADLVQALPVAPIGWAVVVSRSVSTVMQPLRRLGFTVAALLALTVLVAALFGWRMARETGTEVEMLAEGAKRTVEERDPPPLQFSSSEFNAVWQRLRDLFVQLAESGERTRTAQRNLQAVLDAATQVAIIATDKAGVVTVFNVGAQRLLGWPVSEVISLQKPTVWHDPAELAERSAELSHRHGLSVEGFEVLVFEARHSGYEVRDWRLLRKDGSRVDASVAVTAMRTQDGALTGFLLVGLDITERRRAEQLELATRVAEAANRAKSEFLSRMSHELRTPLNAILGYAQLLDGGPASLVTPQQHERLMHIKRAGWHLVRLIDDVLDLARIEAGGLSVSIGPLSLAPVFEQAADIIQPLLQLHQVTLAIEVKEDLPSVSADETRLLQVLVNLLGNAAKYNSVRGKITLSAHNLPEGVQISVTDTGPGMTQEQQSHLFEPFNRLGRERSGIEGTGIGLVVTRHLVELMHGQIAVESVVGHGTTIRVLLPRSERAVAIAQARADEPVALATEPRPARGRVLYIEDNDVNAQLMRAVLRERPDVQLEICSDAKTGLATIERNPPDLVLLDLHLPDAQGGEAVLAALNARPGSEKLAIVVVSADATKGQIEAARALGVRDYLTKPLDIDRTLRVIDEILSGVNVTGT